MKINITAATPADWSGIKNLRTHFRVGDLQANPAIPLSSDQQTCFLIGDYTLAEFSDDLAELFLVAKVDQTLVGYIRVQPQAEFTDNEYKVWHDEQEKVAYYHLPHAEVGATAVHPQYQGQGIASQLLAAARDKLLQQPNPVENLYSIITVGPIKNQASLNFHQSRGFRPVAHSLPTKLFGINNYQSQLWKLGL